MFCITFTTGIDMKSPASRSDYRVLKSEISLLLQAGRAQAGRVVNTILVQTYWQIGKHIVEFEQGGEAKSKYGSNLLGRLSRDLSLEFGKGFGRSNLFYIRKLYLAFQNSGIEKEELAHELEKLLSNE